MKSCIVQAERSLDNSINQYHAHIPERYHWNFEDMAIEQLFEALPLHYLQHGISKFGATSVALAVVVTAFLGVLTDYAWMLYMRSKMVSLIK